MQTSSYSQINKYITGMSGSTRYNIANSAVLPSPSASITVSSSVSDSKKMMESASVNSLYSESNHKLVYVSRHTGSKDNKHAWLGWTEATYSTDNNAGGAVRAAILSGSYGEFKKARVDSELNSETISTSWSASIGENLKVGNAVGVAGYVQIGGNTASLQAGAETQASAITPKQGTDSGVSNLRLIVSGNELTKGDSYTTGNDSISGSLNVKGRARITGALQVVSNAAVTGNLDVGGNESITGSLYVSHSIYGYENLYIVGDASVSGAMYVSGTAYFRSNSYVDHSESVRDLTVRNNANLKNKLVVDGKSTFNDDVDIHGNLLVSGTTTYLNTEDLYVKDRSITVASGATSPADADGAGFDIAGAGVKFHYNSTRDVMTLNKGLEVSGSLRVSESIVSPLVSSSKVVATSVTASNLKVTNTASIAQANVTNLEATGNISGSASGSFKDLSVANKTTTKYATIQGAAGQNALTITTGSISAPKSDATLRSVTASVVSASFVGDGSQLTGITASVVETTTYSDEFHGVDATHFYEFQHPLDSEEILVEVYEKANIKESGSNTVRKIQIIPEQISIVDSNRIQVVFGRAIVSGSIVVAKAGHIVNPWGLNGDTEWLNSHSVHYGSSGSWEAKSFTSNTASTEILTVSNYIDAPRIGNLDMGYQYYTGKAWGSYIEFDDRYIDSFVKPGANQDPILMSRLSGSGDLHVRGAVFTNQTFATSDRNFKTNIRPIENALEAIKKIPGVRFNWIGTGEAGIGTIAQDVRTIYPELTKLVTNLDDKEQLTVDYSGLVGVLIAAVQELSEKVEQLENKVKNNENR